MTNPDLNPLYDREYESPFLDALDDFLYDDRPCDDAAPSSDFWTEMARFDASCFRGTLVVVDGLGSSVSFPVAVTDAAAAVDFCRDWFRGGVCCSRCSFVLPSGGVLCSFSR